MKHRALDEVYCSVARTSAVLGDRWTMLLREAFHGTAFERVRYCAKPERFEYRLTRKGLDLSPVAEYAPGAW